MSLSLSTAESERLLTLFATFLARSQERLLGERRKCLSQETMSIDSVSQETLSIDTVSIDTLAGDTVYRHYVYRRV